MNSRIFGLVAASVGAISLSSAAALAETLRFANFIPPKAAYSPVFQEFADDVTRDSGGALKIQVFHGGTLGPNSAQQLKLVDDGVAHIAFVVPSYSAGRFPGVDAVGIPFLIRTVQEGALALTRLYERGVFPEFDDYKVLGLVTTYVVHLHTRTRVQRLEDARGLRIRVSGGLSVDTIKALGAAPVQIGGGEVAESLSRGVIDGVLGEPLFIATYRMQETAKHHAVAPLGAVPLMVVMRKATYDKLPPAGKSALDKHSGMPLAAKWARNLDQGNAKAIENFAAAAGNTVTQIGGEEAARWEAATKAVAEQWAAKTPHNAHVLRELRAELERIRKTR